MSAIILNYEFGLLTMKRDFTNLVMGFFDEPSECDEQQKHILSVILLQPEELLAVTLELLNYLSKMMFIFVNTGLRYITSFINKSSDNDDNDGISDDVNCEYNHNTNVNTNITISNFCKCIFVKLCNIGKHYINNILFLIIRKIKANFSVFLFNFEKKLIRQWG